MVLNASKLVAGAALALAATTAAADAVKIPKSVPFESATTASEAVRKECALETQIPAFIEEAAKGGAVQSDDLSSGKVLTMKITHVLAPGGGAWSGPKSVKVDGELKDGGKVVGTFQARRNTMSGGFGTCSMLTRAAKAVAEDIATWLTAPTMDSRLGDVKK